MLCDTVSLGLVNECLRHEKDILVTIYTNGFITYLKEYINYDMSD